MNHCVLSVRFLSFCIFSEQAVKLESQKAETDQLKQQLEGTVWESENINRKTHIYVIRVATWRSD